AIARETPVVTRETPVVEREAPVLPTASSRSVGETALARERARGVAGLQLAEVPVIATLGEEGHADDADGASGARLGGVGVAHLGEPEGGALVLALPEAVDVEGVPRADDVAAVGEGARAAVHHVEAVDGRHRLEAARRVVLDADRVALAFLADDVGAVA